MPRRGNSVQNADQVILTSACFISPQRGGATTAAIKAPSSSKMATLPTKYQESINARKRKKHQNNMRVRVRCSCVLPREYDVVQKTKTEQNFTPINQNHCHQRTNSHLLSQSLTVPTLTPDYADACQYTMHARMVCECEKKLSVYKRSNLLVFQLIVRSYATFC